MKLIRNIIEGREMRVARAKDYPFKSGELYGDFVISMFGGFMIAIMFLTLLDTYDSASMLKIGAGVALGLMFLFSSIFNFYLWSIKPMKKYEELYGPSRLGEEWLRTKRHKTNEQIKTIQEKYFK